MSPDLSKGAEHSSAKPETRPFSIRMSDAEKRLLLVRALRVPLGTFIRDAVLSGDAQAKRRRQANG